MYIYLFLSFCHSQLHSLILLFSLALFSYLSFSCSQYCFYYFSLSLYFHVSFYLFLLHSWPLSLSLYFLSLVHLLPISLSLSVCLSVWLFVSSFTHVPLCCVFSLPCIHVYHHLSNQSFCLLVHAQCVHSAFRSASIRNSPLQSYGLGSNLNEFVHHPAIVYFPLPILFKFRPFKPLRRLRSLVTPLNLPFNTNLFFDFRQDNISRTEECFWEKETFRAPLISGFLFCPFLYSSSKFRIFFFSILLYSV